MDRIASTLARKLALRVALAGLIACGLTPAHAELEDDIEKLILADKSEDAYQLAQRNLSRLGSARFDYLYGAAAVQSGRSARGVLALERVVRNNPQMLAARLALARGYFLTGDDQRASEEFNRLLSAPDLPEEARNIARQHLTAITERNAKARNMMQFFAEVTVGRDSNVVSGVTNANVSIPVFGVVTIDPSGVKRGDNFAQVVLGYTSTVQFRSGWGIFSTLALQARRNAHEKDFDQDSLSAVFGGSYGTDTQSARLGMFTGLQTLGDHKYRGSLGQMMDWTRDWTPAVQTNTALARSKLSYVGTNNVRDSTLVGPNATLDLAGGTSTRQNDSCGALRTIRTAARMTAGWVTATTRPGARVMESSQSAVRIISVVSE